jgi:hypothetical protein
VFSHSADIYDDVYSFKDYVSEAERVHTLIEERSPDASTLLGVACGTGKHLEQLRAWPRTLRRSARLTSQATCRLCALNVLN